MFLTAKSFGQNICFCDSNQFLNESIDCTIDTLLTGDILYYQHNCDSIWLTLKIGEKKMILFATETVLYGYHYRLDPHLINEFDDFILFRYGCPANGPCNYFAVDKRTGERTFEFGELIFKGDGNKTNFVIALGDMNLLVFNLNTKEVDSILFDTKRLTEIIPEYQFGECSIKNGYLIMPYSFWDNETNEEKTETLIIEINKYNR